MQNRASYVSFMLVAVSVIASMHEMKCHRPKMTKRSQTQSSEEEDSRRIFLEIYGTKLRKNVSQLDMPENRTD